MPRPKKAGAPEPKRRSRNGCWPCKSRKVKCGEEKPQCLNCERQGETCDYSIRLNWGGRTKNKDDNTTQVPGVGVIMGFQQAQFMTATPKQRKVSVSSASSQQTTPNDQRPAHIPPTSAPIQAADRTNIIDPCLANLHTAPDGNPMMLDGSVKVELHSRQSITRPMMISNTSLPMVSESKASNVMGRASLDYPSPMTDASTVTMDSSGVGSSSTNGTTPMLPPLRGPPSSITTSNVFKGNGDIGLSPERQSKRMKMCGNNDSTTLQQPYPSTLKYEPESSASVLSSDVQSPGQPMLTPYSPYGSVVGTPLTPGSSTTSDDNGMKAGSRTSSYHSRTDFRRLSVNSLLSAPAGTDHDVVTLSNLTTKYPFLEEGDDFRLYGFDHGDADFDLPSNDDKNAVGVSSPSHMTRNRSFPNVHQDDDDDDSPNYGYCLHPKEVAFARGGYYAQPVPIRIPHMLEPLPSQLLDNPMNLLYFHHFLNHTARILVPHDCQANPFRNILPLMAIRNPNLMNLLLAYSASHRARLLNHREPSTRIAYWVQHVFPNLRRALNDHSEEAINANLATSLMLASLEIISPNCFDVPVTWQVHLSIARSLILARGGPRHIHRKDAHIFFLSRWFAYMDITGALSGRNNNSPLEAKTWSYDYELPGDDQQIDCLMGFTFRVMGLLAHVAELSKKVDNDRIDTDTGNLRSDWTPSFEIVAAAEKLERELNKGRESVHSECKHGPPPLPLRAGTTSDPPGDPGLGPGGMGMGLGVGVGYMERDPEQDALEAQATNEAWHCAGLILLYRRVLGRPCADPVVQAGVQGIVSALSKVRRGSSAEASLLLPVFAAGCEALKDGDKQGIMERVRSVEGFGMTHWRRARMLMKEVWQTGRPWFVLVNGEYFG